MSEVNNVNTSILDQYSLTKNQDTENKKSSDLGQGEFLHLMIAQLQNQDPLSPQENGEFISQLAEFSSVDGIERLNDSVNTMGTDLRSSQALQASSLVGQSVIVSGTESALLRDRSYVTAFAELPSSTGKLTLNVANENGELLEQIDLGTHAAGDISVRWNGLGLELDGEPFAVDVNKLNRQEILKDGEGNPVNDDNGNPIYLPYESGSYSLKLVADIGGQEQALSSSMASKVDSVTLATNGNVLLNLAGGNKTDLANVQQILE